MGSYYTPFDLVIDLYYVFFYYTPSNPVIDMYYGFLLQTL